MRAVISGYYGKGNGGDEALLMSLLQMLPPQIEPIVLSGNPEQTQQRYGVKSCPNRSAFPILQALRTSDIFIWGGGSLMQDVTSLASPIYYAGLMALAQKKGLKTIAWAQGIGPLNHPFTRWLTRQVLLGCTAVSVRDYNSAKLVSQWQINPLIAPDPVWALNSKSVPGLWNLPAPRVAVNLRSHPQLTPQRLAILTQALIDFQKATNTCLLLVPFQASQDLEIARSIAAKLPGFHQIIQLEDPRELKGLFKGVEMTIGMRLHSLIMAASEECRCFALSYDPKVKYLMEEIDIPGWELSKLPDDPNIISTAWLEYFVNGEALHKDRIKSLTDRAFMHQEILRQVMLK
ncbi:polysaccharide pyruvyl transferase CsaB [Crocosphaera sp. XPORK-15E]|uniref:polysaccharide pyruvyl transferase CsaB n=1 Tax=Crocosphaera sp. XPORK-15E TaxID=3110247 RepID=UPI002B20A4E2|nr:polysaccharide pyruvyl transferase CsaB [Crocosphaera sp. XPORK-15E]MEA5533949.1 polysaccharide pyruvyl transferase CsaB [Crocosphaera sp. XPORK-15E]